MPRGRIRTALDAAKISALVQRPGIDPRINLTLGVVSLLGFDSQYGIFADVQFIPSGETETCLVAAPYAGAQFGMWCPLRVDDTVVVAVPLGDPDHGPVIIARLWNSGDPPHDDFKNPTQDNGDDVPSDDLVIRVRKGQKLTIRTSDDSDANTQGSIDIKVEGDGTTTIENAGTGNIVVHQSGSSGDIAVYSDNGVTGLGAAAGDSSLKGVIKNWDDLITYLDKNKTLTNDMQTDIMNMATGLQSLNVVGEAALINPLSSFTPQSQSDDPVPAVPEQSTKVKTTDS